MEPLFRDTDAKTEQLLIELLRKAPSWRKVEMVDEINETVRTLMLSGLRQRHPNASPEQLRRAMADLLLGPELAARVYGPFDFKELN